MQSKIKAVTVLLLINCFVSFSQQTRKDTINSYFNQIEYLLNNKNTLQKYFPPEQDLLERAHNSTGIDKVEILFQLYSYEKYKDAEKAAKFNSEASKLSNYLGYSNGVLLAKYNETSMFFLNGAFGASMELLDSISSIKNIKDFPKVNADVDCLKSVIHTERGEYDYALDLALKLLEVGEKTKDNYVLMKAHGALLHYYIRNENYTKALHHCLLGLDYTIKLKQILYLYFKVDEIARILSKLGDIDGALEAYAFYTKIDDKIDTQGGYIHSIVYMNMADIYINNNAYNDAHDYLSKALEINYTNDYKFRIPRALILQAQLYLKTGDTLKGIDSYEESLQAAEDINAFDVVKSNSEILGELYRNINDLDKAYEYTALHNSIRDSLFSNEKEQKIIILESQRKIKEISQQQQILKLENDAQKGKIRFAAIILVILISLSIVIVLSYLKVKGKNKILYSRTIEFAKIQLELEEKNILISKEIKNPIKTAETTSSAKSSNTIDESTKDIILNKLNKLEEEQFFLDQNCNLNQIARQLKTNPKYLSQVINQEKQSNFNNYINELRINYLLTRLLKDQDFRESKLSYIAATIGYNNPNTFNSAFKKRQGILPSYFINELIQDSNKTNSLD